MYDNLKGQRNIQRVLWDKKKNTKGTYEGEDIVTNWRC